MDNQTKQIIETGFKSSNEGTAHFGQIVQSLLDAGVESYHVDYRAGRATYYMPSGQTLSLAFPATKTIGAAFDAPALRDAISGAQGGTVMYPEFKILSQAAGCIGYTVWLTGRHVTYYGRRGETHVEKFPD